MFLYDTSIMKIKAGGLGGFLSYTEKNPKKTTKQSLTGKIGQCPVMRKKFIGGTIRQCKYSVQLFEKCCEL